MPPSGDILAGGVDSGSAGKAAGGLIFGVSGRVESVFTDPRDQAGGVVTAVVSGCVFGVMTGSGGELTGFAVGIVTGGGVWSVVRYRAAATMAARTSRKPAKSIVLRVLPGDGTGIGMAGPATARTGSPAMKRSRSRASAAAETYRSAGFRAEAH